MNCLPRPAFRRHRPRAFALSRFALPLLALCMLAPAPAQAAGISLTETGSTLLYPLFQLWIRDYAGVAPEVSLAAAATGSGAGEKQAIAGQAQIGASDAYL